ncbi:EAL domain-containing protein [Thiocystis violacea]|uniref:EAL domain-containing protein n=1 Tax=Thiocystis violacea TaxID=13725 RepID=UPI001907B54D|nr:hypothetical protein [Thiocystis violacea]
MDSARTILVVDDRAINREFLASLLGYAHYEVMLAADGAEALRLATRSRPDLVITDVLMPNMDGVELAQRLRADPLTAPIPIVFYTATYRLEEARELANASGVERVIAKPASPAAILEAVAELVGRPAPDARDDAMAAPPGVPPGLLGGLASNLSGLGELQGLLQRMLQQGQSLLQEGGRARELSAHLEQSLGAAQSLGLRLTALIELGLELASEREPGRLLELFSRAVQDIMNARYAAAALLDRGGRVTHLATRGLPDPVRAALTSQPPSGLIAQALRGGTPQCVRDWSGQTPPPGLPPGHPPLRTLLVLPIRSALRTYGWLYLADKLGAGDFVDEDEQIAATFAAQLALACENLALFEDAQTYARQLEQEVIERRASERRFRQLAENIREVFWLTDPEVSEFFYVSPAYEEVWGRSRASLYAAPTSWQEPVHPDDREAVRTAMSRMRETGRVDILFRLIHPDTGIRWVNARGFPIRDDRGALIRVAGLAEDVTEKKQQQDRIARLNRVHSLLSGINAAIVRIHERQALFDETCRLAVEEGAFTLAWIGLLDGETLRPLAWRARDPPMRAQGLRLIEREADASEARAVLDSGLGTVRDDPRRGDPDPDHWIETLDFHSRIILPLSLDGATIGTLMFYAREADFFDAEERRLLDELAGDISFALRYIAREERLDYLAYYDVLTGLPNRRLFVDRLDRFLQGSQYPDQRVAAILVDLDHFKQINDTHGRHVGDALLKAVADRLTSAIEQPSSLARVGPDTFAIALAALPESTDALGIMKHRILDPLEPAFVIAGTTLHLGVHAGIALYPGDGDDGETLFVHAEDALRQAQSSGEPYLYFAADANARIAEKLELEEDLRQAVEQRRFVIHIQPKVSLRDGAIVGGEALLRWNHPVRGLVPPASFIALAEETGLIVPIGEWVLRTVCAQQALWLKQHRTVPVGVNLSAVQFRASRVLDLVRDALGVCGLAPGYLDLELTESLVMQNPEEAARILGALRELGVSLSMDDFGTGYSSLAQLKRFPFNTLKIDRAFIIDIVHNPEDAAIATAIITLARRLGMNVVAEGVETIEQLEYLREAGCDEMQGYLFSQPVPLDDFEAMLMAERRLDLPATSACAE